MMVIIYNNNQLCRIINLLCIEHNVGREGDRKVGKRWRREREGDKKVVEVKRRKEEEREGTEGERKITFCRAREREREIEKGREREIEREREGASREKERGRELVERKRMGESDE